MDQRSLANITDTASDKYDLYRKPQNKVCYFYKDGDLSFSALRLIVNRRNYHDVNKLKIDLTHKVSGLPNGVRSIFTPRGGRPVVNIDQLENNGHYICSTFPSKAKGLDITKVFRRQEWHSGKPISGKTELRQMLVSPPETGAKSLSPLRMAWNSANMERTKTPKKVTFINTEDTTQRHVVLINRKTRHSFEDVLSDVRSMFRRPLTHVFTMDGKPVKSLTHILRGEGEYFVGQSSLAMSTCSDPGLRVSSQLALVDPSTPKPKRRRHRPADAAIEVKEKLRDRKTRLARSQGKWQVRVQTGSGFDHGTTATVGLTLCGEYGDSGQIELGPAGTMQRGGQEDFEIDIESIGEVFKIRMNQDNFGDQPNWFLEEVRMRDMHTNELLVFHCGQWLMASDNTLTRELLPIRGQSSLRVKTYEVTVYTGDRWNACTKANVCLKLIGHRGDSGTRKLLASEMVHMFRKGNVDKFCLHAVDLGPLNRVVVSHDNESPGQGWYLECIRVREQDNRLQQDYVFPCDSWLDTSLGDKKIERTLAILDYYNTDIIEKKMWLNEKWKFASGNEVLIFSCLSEGTLRLLQDNSIDATGLQDDKYAVFSVIEKQQNVRIFQSSAKPKQHIVLDNARVRTQNRAGAYCELKLRCQSDRSFLLESTKYNGQAITVNHVGKMADCRSQGNPTAKQFTVYCKGVFRNQGTIVFYTSLSQMLSCDVEGYLSSTCEQMTTGCQFCVHKIGDYGNIRTFENNSIPGCYLQWTNNGFDCLGTGDSSCHFRVHRYRSRAYFVLESLARGGGHFLGMKESGEIDVFNTSQECGHLYPRVIEFGFSKRNLKYSRPNSKETLKGKQASIEDIEISTPSRPGTVAMSVAQTPTPVFSHPHIEETQVLSKCESVRSASISIPEREQTTVLSVLPPAVKPTIETPQIQEIEIRRKSSRKQSTASIIQEGDYKLWVNIGDSNTNGVLSLTIYGETLSEDNCTVAHNKQIILSPQFIDSDKAMVHGRIEMFKINLHEIGSIFKVRLQLRKEEKDMEGAREREEERDSEEEEEDNKIEWNIIKMKLKNLNTLETVRYPVNCRLAYDDSSTVLSKEIASVLSSQAAVTPTVYRVQITTGQLTNSGTNAKVRINLFGDRSDTGDRLLLHSGNLIQSFSTGQVDIFDLEAVCIGNLIGCRLSHDTIEPNHGWYVQEVKVIEQSCDYFFKFNCWLDSNKGDGAIEKYVDLFQGDEPANLIEPEITSSPPSEASIPDDQWIITIHTSDAPRVHPSKDNFELVVYRSIEYEFSKQEAIQLKAEENLNDYQYQISLPLHPENLFKMRLNALNNDLDLFIEKVSLVHSASGDVLDYLVNQQLNGGGEIGSCSTSVEFAMNSDDKVVEYRCEVYSGSRDCPRNVDFIAMTLVGQRSDSGSRCLIRARDLEQAMPPRGYNKIDDLIVKAVDLKLVTSVIVELTGKDANEQKEEDEEEEGDTGALWSLDKICIYDSTDTNKFYQFTANRVFDKDNRIFEFKPEIINSGDWSVILTTGDLYKADSTAKMALVVLGNDFQSRDIYLGDNFIRNSSKSIKVNIGEFNVQEIKKLRIGHNSTNDENNWYLTAMTIEDLFLDLKYTFEVDRWIGVNSESWCELAWPTNDLKEVSYMVSMQVEENAGDPQPPTVPRPSSIVHMKLQGSNGDSGERRILGEGNTFEVNKKSVFSLKAVGLLELKNIIISTNDLEAYDWSLNTITVDNIAFTSNQKVFETDKNGFLSKLFDVVSVLDVEDEGNVGVNPVNDETEEEEEEEEEGEGSGDEKEEGVGGGEQDKDDEGSKDVEGGTNKEEDEDIDKEEVGDKEEEGKERVDSDDKSSNKTENDGEKDKPDDGEGGEGGAEGEGGEGGEGGEERDLEDKDSKTPPTDHN